MSEGQKFYFPVTHVAQPLEHIKSGRGLGFAVSDCAPAREIHRRLAATRV